jgi:hypothetical protein
MVRIHSTVLAYNFRPYRELNRDSARIANAVSRLEGVDDSVSPKFHSNLLKTDVLSIAHDMGVE